MSAPGKAFLLTVGAALLTGCGQASIDAGIDQTVYEGEDITLIATNTSTADLGDYLWEQLSGPLVSVINATSNVAIFEAPRVDEETQLIFQITAHTDVGEISVPVFGFSLGTPLSFPTRDTVTITILPVVCTADAGLDTTALIDETVTLRGNGSSEPNETVSYKWTQVFGPEVVLSSRSSDSPTFTADVDEGELEFELEVSVDDLCSDTDSVIVTVQAEEVERDAPTADAGANQSVVGEAEVALDGSSSTEQDGGILEYAWEQVDGTEVTLSNADTATPSFTAPDVDSTTLLTFELTVTAENAQTDTDLVNITVTPASESEPDAPTAVITADGTFYDGLDVTLSAASSSAADDGELTYAWAIEGVSLSDSTAAIITFTAPTVTEVTGLLATLTVTAENDATDIATKVITINPYPDPTCNAGSDQVVNEGTSVTLNGGTSSDPLGDSLTYTWTIPTGITASSSTNAVVTFTAPTVTADKVFSFTLRVTNVQGDSSSCTIDVTVRNTS